MIEDKDILDGIKLTYSQVFYCVQSFKGKCGSHKSSGEANATPCIGMILGVDNRVYQSKVISLLRNDCHDEIVNALSGYLPNEIPR